MSKQLKKKNNGKVFLAIAVFIFTCGSIAAFAIVDFYKKESIKSAYYQSFKIDIPGNYTVHGIDLSKHQGSVRWDVIKRTRAGNVKVDFVFIKATEGLRNVDTRFGHNWKEAKRANIPRGAYHFFIATKSGTAQAQNFIKAVTLMPGDLPPVLDIEKLYGASPKNMRNELKIWLKQVEKVYNVKPIIYTYIDFYENYLGTEFDEYPLWIAHYLQKEEPRISRNWSFWQHSEEGNINGIKTNVDFNVFNGSKCDFEKLRLK